MGQKIDANGFRFGINKPWRSSWFAAKKDFATYLLQDHKIREVIYKNANKKVLATVKIHRVGELISVQIETSAPGLILGKNGENIEKLTKKVKQELKIKQFRIEVISLENLNLDGQIIANQIAENIENRVSFRYAQKKAIAAVMNAGAFGVKVKISGRLAGADIARSDGYTRGKVPLQTIRSDISYGFTAAKTKYGMIGVKVWIYRGEILKSRSTNERIQRVSEFSEKRIHQQQGGDRHANAQTN